mmetsp:Transcript_7294/g.17128  ORF Transcript_7294/g.17128 Transcript_7294/m.17128 type:complete len:323 (-) Transcript_7294:846-1814(-)
MHGLSRRELARAHTQHPGGELRVQRRLLWARRRRLHRLPPRLLQAPQRVCRLRGLSLRHLQGLCGPGRVRGVPGGERRVSPRQHRRHPVHLQRGLSGLRGRQLRPVPGWDREKECGVRGVRGVQARLLQARSVERRVQSVCARELQAGRRRWRLHLVLQRHRLRARGCNERGELHVRGGVGGQRRGFVLPVPGRDVQGDCGSGRVQRVPGQQLVVARGQRLCGRVPVQRGLLQRGRSCTQRLAAGRVPALPSRDVQGGGGAWSVRAVLGWDVQERDRAGALPLLPRQLSLQPRREHARARLHVRRGVWRRPRLLRAVRGWHV